MAATPSALGQALLRAGDAWAQAVERFLQERFGISYAQFVVLDLLRENPGIQQGDLARRLGRSKGNMTGVLGRLEKAGLVERRRVDGNRRAYALTITDKGTMAALVGPELAAFAERVLGRLSAAERAALAGGLDRLAEALANVNPAAEAKLPAGRAAPEPGAPETPAPDASAPGPSEPAGPPILVDDRPHRPFRVVPGRGARGPRSSARYGDASSPDDLP